MTIHKNALITGSARRIGAAIARALAADGWSIAIHVGQSVEEGRALAGELHANGIETCLVSGDLARERDVPRIIAEATDALGTIDCLVNNASVFEFDSIETLTPASWDRAMDVNVRAPVLLTQAFANRLPEGAQGNVINIIDQRVWKPTPRFLSYAISKSALWSATQMLAQALAPRIRVNGIGPGPVLRSEHQTEEAFRQECEATILGRGTSPQEIAKAVRFILDAPAMTGQMIALDGGQHLAWQTPDVVHDGG